MSDHEMLKADGFDEAIIGIASRCAMHEVYAYDVDKMLDILMQRDGMTLEEAWEYFDFNIEGAYMGEGTPIYIHKITDIEEDIE